MTGPGDVEQGSMAPPRRRPSRRRRAATVLAVMIVAGLVALWIERRPIAGRFVDRELATRGVPARYTISDLGLGRQRLTNVVIGDPAQPDLVADWIETRVGYGLSGPTLSGVSAGRVRVRGRWGDGRPSLGALDKLLPPPSGAPLTLPELRVDVEDARLRLETPWGVVGARLAGAGRLDDGFTGRLAIAAERIGEGGCVARGVRAAWSVRTTGIDRATGQGARLSGPVLARRMSCGGAVVVDPRADVAGTLALGAPRRSSIEATLASGEAAHALGRAAGVSGTVAYDGRGRAATGRIDLAARTVRSAGASADRVRLTGGLAERGAGIGFDGDVRLAGADLSAYAPRLVGVAAGTPVAPLVGWLGLALRDAARTGDARARVTAVAGDGLQVAVGDARWRSASGATIAVTPRTDAPAAAWSTAGLVGDAVVRVGGGGLPSGRATIARPAPGRPWRGVATIAPYAAGGARIAATPIAFAVADNGAARVSTQVTLSGPLSDGRVEGLTTMIDVRRDGRGGLIVNPGCGPVSWQRLAVGPLDLAPASMALCPTGAALVQGRGGVVSGGARTAATTLRGRLGGSPLVLETGAASLSLGDRGFRVANVAARIGQPGRESRLAIATLSGTVSPTVGGRFAGGGGRIGTVPLVLSAAEGDWSFAGGALTLGGALTVSDAADAARFKPMVARGVDLRLARGRIDATATLVEPVTGTSVADVAIAHTLSSGTGSADLTVPRLAFREGFQPDLLTPLTFGVVADVRGDVKGAARIDWNPDGVRSTGQFGTEALDLAAAFGPVSGIATVVRFDDLLGMHTPPGQVATVRSVNPGIAVENGTVRYQILAPTLVEVAGAEWPFAGGTLTLAPTRLDFSRDRERRMTFRVDGAAADRFLQQFDFENVQATGVFDGTLPMIFDERGGRIEGGSLTVREGGGTLAYVGALTQEQLGTWGNLAFQALKSLRYRNLSVTLNGPLAGEMVTDVRFAGISQGEGAKANFLVRRLQRLPFVFNIRITAPFRGLLDSAQSFYDPKRLIQRNLPALLDEQNKRATPPVQPPASEIVR